MISDKQSYSWIIRDVFFAAIAPLPFFATFTKRRTKQLPIQPPQLPYLGVYIIDDLMVPDGDFNAGHISFEDTLRIGFSAIIQNNDPVASEQVLDEAYWLINNTIWRDQYVMNMLDTLNPETGAGNPDNTRIEGIKRCTRRHVFGGAGAKNETPFAELQYEVSCFSRPYFPPIITDDLLMIRVETAFPGGDPEYQKIQQIVSIYEFTPSNGGQHAEETVVARAAPPGAA